ncbi:MAG: Co2+/Mg2+ efflux protein ApaG [Gemmatimonadota bacterium]|nr:Co2+/Mg2+ efflux protein ApaG [Gemmatimonadota bacterium]
MFQPVTSAPGRPPLEPREMRITVEPHYLADHSDPGGSHYVFAYDVSIENVGAVPAKLFWRHWYIHDPAGADQEVEGEGVVGESPRIEPGATHSYQSFCILRGQTGHMEGFYHFRRDDGSQFRAPIPRFVFHVPPGEGGTFPT